MDNGGFVKLSWFQRIIDAVHPVHTSMPMIIEHLTTDEEYRASVSYLRSRLAQ